MKKFLVLCCCLLLWLPSQAKAFPNEPEGFRGLKWGAPFPVETNLRDKEWQWEQSNRLGPGQWYQRYDPRRFNGKSGGNTFGSFPVRAIYYLFQEDRLVSVEVEFGKETVPEELIKDLALLWGEPSESKDSENYRSHLWIGRRSHITLYFRLTEDKKLSTENTVLVLYEATYKTNKSDYKDLSDEQKKIIALQNDL